MKNDIEITESDLTDEELQPTGQYIHHVKGLPIKYKQKEAYGCGSYSLANIFNEPKFLNHIQKDKGDRFVDMNLKLSQVMPEIYAEPYCVVSVLASDNRITDIRYFTAIISSKDAHYAYPFLMIIWLPKSNICHCVGLIYNFKNELFYVVDSREDTILKFKLKDLFEYYWIVGIEYFGFWADPNIDNSLYLIKESMPHIFEPGE